MLHKLILNNIVTLSAGVDLESGVEQITQRVTQAIKGVTPLIFVSITVLALVFTIFHLVRFFMAYREGAHHSPIALIFGAIATVVCGMFTTGAFFGWFGV